MNQPDKRPYPSGPAMWAAVRSRAKNAAKSSESSPNDLLRQFVYTRLLARVFSSESAHGWVLNGGTAILAREPNARHTADVDLLRQRISIEDAIADLRTACAVDIGDHFRFEVRSSGPAPAGNQADVRGAAITIDAYCGVRKVDTVMIDLVVGSLMTVEPEAREAALPFAVPGLPPTTFRLYPVVDHLADKVCATEATYGPGALRSSRVRDLVDIVTLARLEDFDAAELHTAIQAERANRRLRTATAFQPPEQWRSPYERLARRSPSCAGLENFDDAVAYARRFLGPVLGERPRCGLWSAATESWS
ncbi:MAG: nucleotidyl transferase AbiEii/AbiGii toxin family protein [Actinomycetia bacterium]|nr:nucleotidyl transferase AbiEii/AbiGii toxin family protein [Actinomycetes bacterium]